MVAVGMQAETETAAISSGEIREENKLEKYPWTIKDISYFFLVFQSYYAYMMVLCSVGGAGETMLFHVGRSMFATQT